MSENELEKDPLSVEELIRQAEAFKWVKPKIPDEPVARRRAKSWRDILENREAPGSADFRPH